MRAQTGFTLIELMIVITIVGVLAAIAIPQYQDYVTRAKLMEGLSLVAQAETSVAAAFQDYSYIPLTGNSTGSNSFDLPAATSISGRYVTSVEVAGGSGKGVITITYNVANVGGELTAASDKLTLSPDTYLHGAIIWACGYKSVTAYGRTVGGPLSGTTIAPKFLPGNCKN